MENEGNEKIRLLEGMDSYLPHVDGVINCMHNYCMHGHKLMDITAVAPKYKNHVDNLPYKIVRCKSLHIPIAKIEYAQATKDRKLKKEILNQDFDIVHVHSPFNVAKFALKVARKKNIPAVITFHSNIRPIVRSFVKSKLITEAYIHHVGKFYEKFDDVFVCSPIVADQLRSYGYKGHITYLPYGTELPKCEDNAELIKQANKKFSLNDDELIFIFVGRIERLKRVDFILRSLKILKDKGCKFKFFVVGKGSDINRIQKLSESLNLSESVIFTGFASREDLKLLNARANLLLFPSLYDNFGLVKVEAAAYSTPGVFIEGSCAGYGVTDGVNGYLSKDSEQDFADKIIQAIESPEKLREVGHNAARDLYISWEDCTKLYVEKLEEIVKKNKAKTS